MAILLPFPRRLAGKASRLRAHNYSSYKTAQKNHVEPFHPLRRLETSPCRHGFRYMDRLRPEDRFTGSRAIAGTSPQVVDPLLTDDCGRLYFNGLGSVLYSEIL